MFNKPYHQHSNQRVKNIFGCCHSPLQESGMHSLMNNKKPDYCNLNK